MVTPVISVLLPVYNAERYLCLAVESILAQTFGDFELIVINDGSTDGSLEILRHYEAQDQRVRLISRPNTGYVAALNEMIGMANGHFLARMDSDDIAMPDRFHRQLVYLNANARIVAAGSHFEIIDDRGRRLHVQRVPLDNRTIQDLAIRGHTPICHPCVMMRTDAVLAAGRYDPAMEPAEDLDLFLRLGEIGELANIDSVLMKYRLHDASVSESRAEKQIDRMREAVCRAGERRGVSASFEGDDGWRPTPDRASQYRYSLKYGWWAFNIDEFETATFYAWKAIRTMPWRFGGWNLWRCARIKWTRKWCPR